MIQIENQTVSGIPFLHIVKEENRHRAVPLVIFIHGFTSAKEHNLHIAYLLAEKGFRAVSAGGFAPWGTGRRNGCRRAGGAFLGYRP